jgi:hypothetical protein
MKINYICGHCGKTFSSGNDCTDHEKICSLAIFFKEDCPCWANCAIIKNDNTILWLNDILDFKSKIKAPLSYDGLTPKQFFDKCENNCSNVEYAKIVDMTRWHKTEHCSKDKLKFELKICIGDFKNYRIKKIKNIPYTHNDSNIFGNEIIIDKQTNKEYTIEFWNYFRVRLNNEQTITYQDLFNNYTQADGSPLGTEAK